MRTSDIQARVKCVVEGRATLRDPSYGVRESPVRPGPACGVFGSVSARATGGAGDAGASFGSHWLSALSSRPAQFSAATCSMSSGLPDCAAIGSVLAFSALGGLGPVITYARQ